MSVNVDDCFETVLGYTRSVNNCIPAEAITDYNVSKSGLYIDEAKGIDQLILDSVDSDIFTLMQRAYQNAIKVFKMDVGKEIMKYNQKNQEKFSGMIGYSQFQNDLSLSGNYSGLSMIMREMEGGKFTLKKIGLMFNKSKTFSIKIYDSIHDDYLYDIEVTSVANKFTYVSLPTAIELPMKNSEYHEPIQYFFVFENNDPTFMAKDAQVICNCGGAKWCFDKYKPCFYTGAKDRWMSYAMVSGISGDVIADRNRWTSFSRRTNGISLEGDFDCNYENVICNDNMDYSNDPVVIGIAMALWHKTAENLLDAILQSPNPNRYTLIGREESVVNRDYHVQKYNEITMYVGENIDVSKSGCYVCKSALGYRNSTIKI